MMTIQYSAVMSTTGGTTAGNTAGIRTSGKKLMEEETTGEVMFVDRRINGLSTITEKEMVLGTQKIRVNGQSKDC